MCIFVIIIWGWQKVTQRSIICEKKTLFMLFIFSLEPWGTPHRIVVCSEFVPNHHYLFCVMQVIFESLKETSTCPSFYWFLN